MSAPAAPAGARLGAFDVGCVVVGGIIGVGIFFTPAKVAAACDGPAQVVVAWSLGGVIAVLGALVFAQLAHRVRDPGGMFAYVHAGCGSAPAFLYGWANWLVIQSGALGVIGIVMVDHADLLVNGRATATPGAKVAIAASAILAFTLVNAVGLRVGKGVQNALTVAKTAAVGGLVLLAVIASGEPEPTSAPAVGAAPVGWLRALGASMLPVLFSFGGWQQGSFVSGAARSAGVVARGILGGVAVVVAAYVAINLAFLSLLGFDGARGSVAIGADAARVALDGFGLGDLGSRAFAGLVVVSSLGILNTICLAPPYVLHAMAQRGLFLPAAGRLHARFGTPVVGILCQGLWAIALLVVTQLVLHRDLGFLLDGVVFVDWLFFALCGISLLRIGGGARARAAITVGITVAFTGLAFAVMAGAIWTSPAPSLAGSAIAAAGVVPWLVLVRRGERPAQSRENVE
ncbi:MAG: APC family permease [Planctomycetes bacterium]|nr:APC family permease [Planctomycetota bacterium]